MRFLRRLLGSRLLRVAVPLFLLVQVVHPGEPLTLPLWSRFGTYVDVPQPASLRARRTADGGLEVRAKVERTSRWLGEASREVDRFCSFTSDELFARGNLYWSREPLGLPDANQLLDPGEGWLPVVFDKGWSFPGYECVVVGPVTYWTSAFEPDGERLAGYRMTLPLDERGDLPGALPARALLTPPLAAFDLLALPRIVGQTILVGEILRDAMKH